MKSIQSIKQNITKFNKYCDKLATSLLECLNSQNISLLDFCNLIGLDITLLNDIALKELQNLLEDKSTRIFYNSGMTNLSQDEISIYSSNLHTNIGFLNDKVKITWDNSTQTTEFQNYDSEFMGTRKNGDALETIHFSSNLVIDPQKANDRILSLKYPLEHACLKIKHTVYKINGEVLNDQSFQITINKDLLYSDLKNIFRILYNFNYSLAVNILKLYPASLKIISDEVTMNNFHNR